MPVSSKCIIFIHTNIRIGSHWLVLLNVFKRLEYLTECNLFLLTKLIDFNQCNQLKLAPVQVRASASSSGLSERL